MKKIPWYILIGVIVFVLIVSSNRGRSFSFGCNSGFICDFISRYISNTIINGTNAIIEKSTPTFIPVANYSTTHANSTPLSLAFPIGWKQNDAVTEDSGQVFIAQFVDENNTIFSISRIPKAPEAKFFQTLPQLVKYLHQNIFTQQSHQIFKEGKLSISNQDGYFFSLKYLQNEESNRPFGYLVYFYPTMGNEYFIFIFRNQNQFTNEQLDKFNSILKSVDLSKEKTQIKY